MPIYQIKYQLDRGLFICDFLCQDVPFKSMIYFAHSDLHPTLQPQIAF